MDEKFDQAFQQAAAFQKMWTDSFAQMTEVWGKFSPGKPPPDAIREIRGEMLKVLADTWDQFMRTPQFMEYMKHAMDGMMNVRQMAAEAMTRGRHEMQAPAREDIDGILLAIRHLERRLLDRIEDIENAVSAVGRRLEKIEKTPTEPVQAAAAGPADEVSSKPSPTRSKTTRPKTKTARRTPK